jgi:hypothetical protein
LIEDQYLYYPAIETKSVTTTTKMSSSSSSRTTPQPHKNSVTELLTKKESKSQRAHHEKETTTTPSKSVRSVLRPVRSMRSVRFNDILWTPSNNPHLINGSSEADMIKKGVSIGAADMRNETIERARSIASAIREQQEQQPQTAPRSFIMHNALLKRLEAKLLANEMECTELQELADAWKGGIPVSTTLLHLGWEPEKVSSLGDASYLLQKVEALVLVKREECNKVRKLALVARKRDSTSRDPKGSMTASGLLPNVSELDFHLWKATQVVD